MNERPPHERSPDETPLEDAPLKDASAHEHSLDEKGRVGALLAEGKISEEEATLLLEALDEADAAETVTDDPEREEGFWEPPTPPTPPAPPQGAAAQTPPEPHGQDAASPQGASAAAAPGGQRRWLHLKTVARNLEVGVDRTLQEPTVQGADLLRSGEDWVVRASGAQDLLSRGGTVEVRLPADCGVDLSAKAGNVEVTDVPYLRGRVIAGNLELRGVRGVELELKAGNLEAELCLTEGWHRIQVSMGNADVSLMKGSDVQVSCKTTVGALHVDGPTRVGAGKATLDVAVKIGNINMRVPRD